VTEAWFTILTVKAVFTLAGVNRENGMLVFVTLLALAICMMQQHRVSNTHPTVKANKLELLSAFTLLFFTVA
jgi:hypothetical protein